MKSLYFIYYLLQKYTSFLVVDPSIIFLFIFHPKPSTNEKLIVNHILPLQSPCRRDFCIFSRLSAKWSSD
jgi:hypothetical protein